MDQKIIGNTKLRNELEKIVQNRTVLHSYLFLGKSGIGKKEIAKEFSKKILCLKDGKEDCTCKSCTCLESNNHPDIQIINEESETIKIGQVREMIKQVYEKPIVSENKIFIINDSDLMTREAQNSLLKTLEEPPQYLIIILTASNQDMLLTTIKSRCTKIVFDKLTTNEIKEILMNNEITEVLSEKQLETADGSVEKALKILNNKENYEQVDKLIETIENQNKIDFLTKNKEIFIKENIYDILEYLSLNIFKIGNERRNINYLNCIQHIQETINRLKSSSNFDMSIDRMLFKIWEEVNENNSRS